MHVMSHIGHASERLPRQVLLLDIIGNSDADVWDGSQRAEANFDSILLGMGSQGGQLGCGQR